MFIIIIIVSSIVVIINIRIVVVMSITTSLYSCMFTMCLPPHARSAPGHRSSRPRMSWSSCSLGAATASYNKLFKR